MGEKKSKFISIIKTGGKLLLLNIIVGLLVAAINYVATIFGLSLSIATFEELNFGLVMMIFFGIMLFVIFVQLFIGGYVAQKMYKWR